MTAPDRGAGSTEIDEAELVVLLRRGDQGVARQVIRLVNKSVRGTLFQVLGPADPDFDDLYQISLERFVSSVMRGKFVGRCSLSTWASVIASRVAIDALRRRRHERRIFVWRKDEDDESWEVPAADSVRPDRQHTERTQLQSIRRALGKISPDKAQTLVLFEVMGHDLSEIAEMMGVSVAAAQSRLVRGRKELATRLRGEWGGEDGR